MLVSPVRTPESVPSPSNKITRGHSCILCQQRKVRCDKQKPCSNCIKARAECVPSAPTGPRRRRRKLTEADLVVRLRRYEHLLKKHGVKLDDEEETANEHEGVEVHERGEYNKFGEGSLSLAVPRAPGAEKGALLSYKGNTHYVENTLWENLKDEIHDPKEAAPSSSSEEDPSESAIYPDPERLLVGHGSGSKDLSLQHPPPIQIFRLWQTFLVNVNPLVKIFHAPTIQQLILDATGDLTNIQRDIEALMFGIYFMAVTSMKQDECQSMCGDSRSSLLQKYSHALQQALVNAKFLKSLNIMTLQAYIFYILGVRTVYDPHSLWILTGATVRIAQRLGLHRDGSSHKVSPFDAEIRRRTWWQIVFLDGYTSKLAGAGFPAWLAKYDTKIPLNISDSDLTPGMRDPPVEKEGATEMMFCCLRFETAQALRGTLSNPSKDGPSTGVDSIQAKDKAIDELEARMEDRFVRFCDQSIPLHLLCTYVARSVICTMRIVAHHPRQYPDKGASMPQREKDLIFRESLTEIQFDNLGWTTKSVSGFLWHISARFQLDAFIYLLSELRHRTKGELVDEAWAQIQQSFENRGEIIRDTKNSLYMAIGNLALKAWKNREEDVGRVFYPPPRFISQLRFQRNIPEPQPPVAAQAPYVEENILNPVPQANIFDLAVPGNDYSFDTIMPEVSPVDWEYWQTLMDGDLPAYNSVDFGSDNQMQRW